jgi:crotonobetainyl-CoA:carnitine CoA-transferase CaiB-like acyl-CoA transferase
MNTPSSSSTSAMSDTEALHRPLQGVRIVESSSYLTGPLTSTMLIDLGAEVIKVEPPGGDAFRAFGHGVAGWSALWTSTNRGKRSIVLDLKAEDDRAAMKRLLADADVLVENWRPHVADSLGLGQEVVAAINPRLVRLSITGFGSSGPLSAAPAFDSLIQARTGMVDLLGAQGQPEVAPYWVVDKVVGTFGAQAVLAALYQRERTGRGSHVSLPMLDVMTYFNFFDMFQHRTFVDDTTPWSPAFSPVLRTSDGHIVLTPVSGAQMSRTLKALDRPDIKAELLAIKDSVTMTKTFYERVGDIVASESSAHWIALFESFDLPVAPVTLLEDHLSDAQVRHNRLFHTLETPVGAIRAVRYPATFDGAMLMPRGTVPRADEQGQEIRRDLGADPLQQRSRTT